MYNLRERNVERRRQHTPRLISLISQLMQPASNNDSSLQEIKSKLWILTRQYSSEIKLTRLQSSYKEQTVYIYESWKVSQ